MKREGATDLRIIKNSCNRRGESKKQTMKTHGIKWFGWQTRIFFYFAVDWPGHWPGEIWGITWNNSDDCHGLVGWLGRIGLLAWIDWLRWIIQKTSDHENLGLSWSRSNPVVFDGVALYEPASHQLSFEPRSTNLFWSRSEKSLRFDALALIASNIEDVLHENHISIQKLNENNIKTHPHSLIRNLNLFSNLS